MDRLEDGCMGFFQFAHAFQRIEQLTVGVPAATEERRNRAEVGMLGQGFLPLADDRLEVEAVAAAVPEQLGYLYLVRLLGGGRRGQLDVVDTGLILGTLGLCQCQAAQQPDQSCSQELAHVTLRTNVAAIKAAMVAERFPAASDRKSTRLNSSHVRISYAV